MCETFSKDTGSVQNLAAEDEQMKRGCNLVRRFLSTRTFGEDNIGFIKDSIAFLKSRDNDAAAQQSVANQFRSLHLIQWSRSENEGLARNARILMSLLG